MVDWEEKACFPHTKSAFFYPPPPCAVIGQLVVLYLRDSIGCVAPQTDLSHGYPQSGQRAVPIVDYLRAEAGGGSRTSRELVWRPETKGRERQLRGECGWSS